MSSKLAEQSDQLQNQITNNTEQMSSKIDSIQNQMTNNAEQLDNRIGNLQESFEIRLDDVTDRLKTISLECKERSDSLQRQINDIQVDLEQMKENMVSKNEMLESAKAQVDQNSKLLAELQVDLANIRLVDKDQEIELGKRISSDWNRVSDRNRMNEPRKIRSEGVRQWPCLEANPTTSRDRLSTDSDSSDSQGSLAHRCKKQKTNLRLREPLFFGDGQTTAPEFINELEDYFALTDIEEDREKIMAFKQMLRGNHARWCQIQLADAISWKQLCERFIAQYFNKTELAQEWESLQFNINSRDCEGFFLKAWQLQTSLHADYSMRKKCSNIIRKLPFHIQVRVKENMFDTFNDFLRIVKVTIKSYHSGNPNAYYTRTYSNTSSPPRSNQSYESSGQNRSNYYPKYQGKSNPNGNGNSNKYSEGKYNESRRRFGRNWNYRGQKQNSYRKT